jgi:hypothetical protein
MQAHQIAALAITILTVARTGPVMAQPPPQPNDARKLKFSATDRDQAMAWQESSRRLLFGLMKLSDLVTAERAGPEGRPGLEFHAETLATQKADPFTRYDLAIDSTPTRRINVVLTVPQGAGKSAAVVCIHGHGGDRNVVYDPATVYHGFALELARRGYVTIAADVGQHEVYEKDRTLAGERLWDLMRCTSYLTTRPEVDPARIGCAGLSLGGEMAMWLGAMDTRIRATVSSGYLTTVANMRQGHCPCWEFPGLTENFDWADIYSLIAPRALLCQNVQKETAPGGFPVSIAEKAMAEIKSCYRLLGREENARLAVHPGGHEFENAGALEFLGQNLRPGTGKPESPERSAP